MNGFEIMLQKSIIIGDLYALKRTNSPIDDLVQVNSCDPTKPKASMLSLRLTLEEDKS